MLIRILATVVFCFSFIPQAYAEDVPAKEKWRNNIPTVLQEWIPWVTREVDQKQKDCLSRVDAPATRLCLWVPKLDLSLTDTGAEASLVIATDAEREIALLPGSKTIWPYKVLIDNVAQPILSKNGVPAISLKRGAYLVRASYRWKQMPGSFPAPKKTALLSLRVNGKKIDFPKRQANGAIWTQRKSIVKEATQANDRIEVEVYRHLIDEIPQRIETVISMRVSGKTREVLFSRYAFLGKIYKIQSPLPIQTNAAKLAVQVRPGTWTIQVDTWLDKPLESFEVSSLPDPWPEEEIWAIETITTLSTIEIEGATSIGIEQTNAPRRWKNFPLFQLVPNKVLKLVEQRRGGSRAARDSLTLTKQLWLSFDGKQFTVKDTIKGSIAKSGRLNYVSQGELGRVSINGVDQYITRLKQDDAVGVEIREGALQLEAESQLPKAGELKSAWDRDFDSVSGTLTLPPGWRVLSASGVDWITNSWIKSWSLLDIFLVLVTSVACYRLFAPWIGLLTACMLVLVEPEQSFSISLLVFLGFAALASVLPKGGLQKLFRYGCILAVLAVSIQALVFSITHIRTAMYPQLKNFYFSSPTAYQPLSRVTPAAAPMETLMLEEKEEGVFKKSDFADEGRFRREKSKKIQAMRSLNTVVSNKLSQSSANQYVVDTNRTSQTGFGVANWSGLGIRFGWNGPVQSNEAFSFMLVSPRVNRVLAFLRVILLVAVIVLTVRRYTSILLLRKSSSTALSFLLFLPLLGLFQITEVQAETELPDKEILEQLRKYVEKEEKKAPDCHPHCISVPSVAVEDVAGALLLKIAVHSQIDTALPLLRTSENFSIQSIKLGGNPVTKLTSSGKMLWLGVKKGVHSIDVLLNIGLVDEFSVQFGTHPAKVELNSNIWKTDAIRQGVLQGNALTLRKEVTAQVESTTSSGRLAKAKKATRLTPLYNIARTITFGVNWTIQTVITRISPATTTEQLQVPLLDGESMTSGSFEVKDHFAQVVIASGKRQVRWESSLEQTESLRLSAAQNVSWSEYWRVNATNLWHVNFEGTPRIYSATASRTGVPEWRPRPGEELVVHITRPIGAEGPTTTIDTVLQEYSVGTRIQEATLTYSVRTSKGNLQEIQLPKDADLSELKVNGIPRPLRATDGKVRIDLAPGSQEISLRWRENRELTNSFRNQPVSLGVAAVNVKTRVKFPSDRWVLCLKGPLIGPVVLFWAVVPICIGVAFLLGRWPRSPLKFYQWLVLFLGLSQVSLVINATIVAWFICFALRADKKPDEQHRWIFRFQQILLAGLTFAAIRALFSAVKHGLLANPSMNIQGISSSAYSYFWFQDSIESVLPQVAVYSLDMFWYRGVMLVWSLWLSFAAIGWLRWAWKSYSFGGYWIAIQFSFRRKKKDGADNLGSHE